MAYGETTNYIDFGGGVNANSGEYLLAENQGKDGRNFRTTPIGSLRKRNGFTTVGAVSTLDSIHSLHPVNTSTKSLIGAGDQAGASSDRIVTVSTGGVPTTLKSGLTLDQRWEWAQAPTSGGLGPMWGLNGVDTPQSWDGSAGTTSDWVATTGTVPLTAKYLIYHTDRLWATGSETYPGRVWYSGLTASAVPAPDPLNWDADGYVDIEPQDGEVITGIGSVGPYLVVFKPRNTYVITDPVSGAWRQVSDQLGCIAHRSIAQTEKGTFFLSEDIGVCVTDGSTVEKLGSRVENVSGPVDPFIFQAANDHSAALHYSTATYWQGSYYLSIPYGDDENDLTLEYNADSDSWWPHDRGVQDWAISDPVGTPRLYSADPGAAVVSRAFVPDIYTDNDEAYTSYYTTAYYPWGEPHLNKRVNQFRMDGNGSWTLKAAKSFTDDYATLGEVTLNVAEASSAFGGSGTYGGTGVFGPNPGISQKAYYTPGFGRAWSLQVEDDTENALEIFSLAAFLRPRSD